MRREVPVPAVDLAALVASEASRSRVDVLLGRRLDDDNGAVLAARVTLQTNPSESWKREGGSWLAWNYTRPIWSHLRTRTL
jgi:hypothetical protein